MIISLKSLLTIMALSFGLTSIAQLYQVPLEEKIKESPLVVEGKIIAQKSFYNPASTFIFTAHQVEVYKIFKGTVAHSTINVLTQGGTVGDKSLLVSDNLEMELGAIGVFFCVPSGTKLRSPIDNELVFDVYSDMQGFFQYDLTTQSAHAPFERYNDIAQELYGTLHQKIGQNYQQKNPCFDLGKLKEKLQQRGPTALGITSFAPSTVWGGALNETANNVLTITGTDFGNAAGSAAVQFDDPNDGEGGNFTSITFNNELLVSWTATEIKVKVPTRSGTGFIRVVDELGAVVASPTKLTVFFNVTTINFTGFTPLVRMYNLSNRNGAGGLSYLYSTSTANGGTDFSSAAERAPFDRSMATLREVIGANIVSGGTTTTQMVNTNDADNIITLDNFTNTGGTAYLPNGVLGRAYTGVNGGGCSSAIPYCFSNGFDVVLRKSGVSVGSGTFSNGPCNTAVTSESDMETVCLHEMGHVLGLGHINDIYEGPGYPFINPTKVMNYFILSGTDRRSPDYAYSFGGKWAVNPKGINFSSCTQALMTPLAVANQPLDDCPAVFPSTPTPVGTVVNFDLAHATSNKFKDPQYTAIFTNGQGTSVTNNAYYAFKAGRNGDLLLNVSNFATTPASQQACTNAGVELSLYQVNICPTGQNFPTPIFYTTFNGNNAISTITVPNLTAGLAYLVHVDGVNNTAATFSLRFSGSALPLKVNQFKGSQQGSNNLLHWDVLSDYKVQTAQLEVSKDGSLFQVLDNISTHLVSGKITGSYTDANNAITKYYRLKLQEQDGSVVYSNIVSLQGKGQVQSLQVFPNPAQQQLNVYVNATYVGLLSIKVTDLLGKVLMQENRKVAQIGLQNIELQLPKNLISGTYLLHVLNGQNTYKTKFMKQ